MLCDNYLHLMVEKGGVLCVPFSLGFTNLCFFISTRLENSYSYGSSEVRKSIVDVWSGL